MHRAGSNGTAGFAVVDALVALVILSSALGLSLAATQSARKLANQAARTRQAEALCRYLLATSADVVGISAGQSAGLLWRLEVRPMSADAQALQSRLCEASVAVRSQDSGRAFVMSTAVSCKTEPAI